MKDTYFDYDEENHHLTTVSGLPGTDDAGREFYLITGVQTSRAGRNQGRARKLLQHVLDQADAEGVILMLSVDPDPGVDFKRLTAWYERLGFKFIEDGDPTMKRFPRPSADYMLDPKTGWKLAEHLELHHGLNTAAHNVREMQNKHRSMHLISDKLAHTHKRPDRKKDEAAS